MPRNSQTLSRSSLKLKQWKKLQAAPACLSRAGADFSSTPSRHTSRPGNPLWPVVPGKGSSFVCRTFFSNAQSSQESISSTVLRRIGGHYVGKGPADLAFKRTVSHNDSGAISLDGGASQPPIRDSKDRGVSSKLTDSNHGCSMGSMVSHYGDRTASKPMRPYSRQTRRGRRQSNLRLNLQAAGNISEDQQTKIREADKRNQSPQLGHRIISKHKIFPLPTKFGKNDSQFPSLVSTFSASLNFLYFGTDLASCPDYTPSLTQQMRYAQHIRNRLTIKLETEQKTSISKHFEDFDKVFNYAQIPAEFPNQVSNMFHRGEFKIIDPARLALRKGRHQRRPEQYLKWGKLLPDHLSYPLTPGFHLTFVEPITPGIKKSKELPRPFLHLKQHSYPQLLGRMNTSGMLYWRIEERKTRALDHSANQLQLKIFAVTKSPDADRLISWPRVCNTFCPIPPEPDITDPSMFSQIRCIGKSRSSFFVDIDNMFHNQRLSLKIADFFPLPAIALSNLPVTLQLAMRTLLKLPNNNDFFGTAVTSYNAHGVPVVSGYRTLSHQNRDLPFP